MTTGTGNLRQLLYHSRMNLPRQLKIFTYIIGLLAALAIVAATAVVLLVDPNDYRDDIQSWVKAQTGQELSIEGDMKLSLFPWIGVELGAVTLRNPPGFADAPLAHIGGAAVKARLLPLLGGRLEVSRITLQGLELNLEIDKEGRANWDALTGTETPASPSAPATEQATPPPSLAALAIGGISLENATLRWTDHSSGQRYLLDELSLETGPIALQRPFDINGRFHLSISDPALRGRINFDSKITLDPRRQTYRAQQFRIEAALEGPALPHSSMRTTLRSNIHVDLASEQVVMEDLQTQLDERINLKGKLQLTNFSQPALRFTADVDQIDLDHYLPETAQSTPATSPGAAAAAGTLALPMEALRGLDLQGRLTVGKLRVSALRISDLAATVQARNGLIRLNPLNAQLYEGHYRGDMLLDVRGKTPLFAVHERLEGVQTGPLLKDYMDNDILVARADAEIRLLSGGLTLDEIQRRLKGTAMVALSDGALKGVNLARMIREVAAAAKGEPLPPDDQPKATDFTDLQATFRIQGGRVSNDNLRMNSPFLRVAGEGEVDLLQRNIDYLLRARLVGNPAGQGGKALEELQGLDIPIRVSGNLEQPKFQVDKAFITHVLRREVEKKIQKKLEKALEKKQDELAPELQQQLKDTFKKLF